eukprot:3341333-Amphidinium_carterae.1
MDAVLCKRWLAPESKLVLHVQPQPACGCLWPAACGTQQGRLEECATLSTDVSTALASRFGVLGTPHRKQIFPIAHPTGFQYLLRMCPQSLECAETRDCSPARRSACAEPRSSPLRRLALQPTWAKLAIPLSGRGADLHHAAATPCES